MKIIRNVVLLLILNLIVVPVFSQTVTNVTSALDGDKIIVHYSIHGAKFYQTFQIALYMSMDGGENYQGPLKAVSGDVGDTITKGNKKIIWDFTKEGVSLEGNMVFDVRAEVIEKERKRSLFLTYFGSSYSPFGFQFGQLGKVGWYVSARANANFVKKAGYDTDDTGIIDYDGKGYYVFDDEEIQKNYTITAGVNYQVGWNLFVYAGVGFGQNQLLLHINEFAYPDDEASGDAYAKHTAHSYSGLAIEAGLMVRVKKILISAGVDNLAFKKTGITFGLGYSF